MMAKPTSASVNTFTARMRWASVQRPDQVRTRSASLFLSESVSDAIEGLDRVELRVDRAEFSADALNVAVDGPVIDIDVVLVSDVEQLVARFHDPRSLR